MGKVIPFHVPASFRRAPKWESQASPGRVIEFHGPGQARYFQPTWIFAEVDADLAAGDK